LPNVDPQETQIVTVIEFGVRPGAIFQDDASRNTRENAVNNARARLRRSHPHARVVVMGARAAGPVVLAARLPEGGRA
jgi:hypothetical protein